MIKAVQTDITTLQMDIIVNAANRSHLAVVTSMARFIVPPGRSC